MCTHDVHKSSLLKSSVAGDVVTSDHPEYGSAIARWAKNAERNALAVVFVKNEKDVAKALAYAKQNAIPIAIRGGGHNAAGASSVESGIIIDLSKYLNHVRIDAERQLAHVGGGAIWRQVDAETIKHGLATVAGTHSTLSSLSNETGMLRRLVMQRKRSESLLPSGSRVKRSSVLWSSRDTQTMGMLNNQAELPASRISHPSGDHNGDARSESAFSTNYPRLRSIKKKLDPENVFNRWFPIIPAL